MFPEEIDAESEMERCPRAIARRFGDTPVIYPPELDWTATLRPQ